ncbi:MAG: chemotaxis protein CheB [Bacteroidota bacterium]|nr:chemotaxis protein CheB [Bacteroidota bacterium]
MQDFSKFKAIVIGGSAGSFPIISKILESIPADFHLPVILCLHRLKHIKHGFVEALNIKSAINIIEPDDKTMIKPGMGYLAPANYHMFVELGYNIALSTEEMLNFSRPSIDLTFDTASYVYKEKLIGIILSGANKDGAEGLLKIKQRGGFTIVQDINEATVKTMPESALKLFNPDLILTSDEIANFVNNLKNDCQ